MAIDNLWLWIACGLSAVTFLVHVIAGGREAARPLLDSQLDTVPKYTNYYCWHLVSITLAAMAFCYFIAILRPNTLELAILATLLAACFALWSIALNVIVKPRFSELPQWILFVPIAIVGTLGVL